MHALTRDVDEPAPTTGPETQAQGSRDEPRASGVVHPPFMMNGSLMH